MDQPDEAEHVLAHVGGLADAVRIDRPPSGPLDLTSQCSTTEPAAHLIPQQPMQAQPFGAALAPVLVEVCKGNLDKVRWFRTDWQRGGALTGYCEWTDDAGIVRPAVVKMPVSPTERRWLVQLSSDEVTPRVYAHGQQLGAYDLCWVVMERLPFGPIGTKWAREGFEIFADAAANFYVSAAVVPTTGPAKIRNWEQMLEKARRHCTPRMLPDSQRWKQALKQANRMLPKWLSDWRNRDMGYWCHGDLHLANAMTRRKPPHGPAVLFDLANVHVGHWVEDAVYLEHLYWSRQETLQGKKPVKLIAHYMHDYGLSPGKDWPTLANIQRALYAMTAPAFLDAEGGRPHAAAALEVLERYL